MLNQPAPTAQPKPAAWIVERWHLLALIAAIALFPWVSQTYYVMRLGVILVINGIIVVGMTLLIRYAGIFSMGQSAFYLIGAYVSGCLTIHLHMNPWLAMLIAAAFSMIVAHLFCSPFLKLRAIYLGIATLGLAQVAYILAKNLDDITGGVAGLPEIPYFSIGRLSLDQDWQIFYLSGIFLIAAAFIADNVARTRLGRAYLAIQANEIAAQSSGVDVEGNMRNIFIFAAVLASLAGSLLAHFITFISPESFTPEGSLTFLIIVIIGGANVWAGLITTVFLLGFSEASRGMVDLSTGLFALLLIVAFFIFPDGLSAVLFKKSRAARKMAARYFARRTTPPPAAQPARAVSFPAGPILEVSDISMNFGGTQALAQVSFSVEYGQIVGIIGPNGAGKTTLLNSIYSYLTPTQGRVIYQGRDVTVLRPYQMAGLGIGRTFQLVNLFKGMTVIENVMVGCHLLGKTGILESGLNLKRSRQEEQAIFDSAVRSLEALDLMGRAYEVVENLSFGEQRTVELARALAMEPKLIFLDEPAAGLNTAEAEKLGNTLRRIRDRGITIIMVEHNMSLVMSVSDKVCVLDFGRLIAEGSCDFICNHEAVIKAYLGPKEAQRAS